MFPPAAAFEQTVSKPRMASYRHYWKATPEEAVGLYMWNGEVCAEVSKLLSYFEIALRNGIHRELSLSATGSASASSHWWDSLPGLKSGTKYKVADVRSDAAPKVLDPDEIVSRLTFGFWPNVLSWVAKTRTSLMFRILPAHPLSQPGASATWNNVVARQDAIREIFELKDLRNRIAHHEPLWKFADVIDTSPVPPALPILVVPASVDETTSLSRFARLLNIYDRAMHALSPTLQGHLASSSWRLKLNFLLSARGLKRYQSGFHVVDGMALGPLQLHERFEEVVDGNRPVRIADQGREGIFVPG